MRVRSFRDSAAARVVLSALFLTGTLAGSAALRADDDRDVHDPPRELRREHSRDYVGAVDDVGPLSDTPWPGADSVLRCRV